MLHLSAKNLLNVQRPYSIDIVQKRVLLGSNSKDDLKDKLFTNTRQKYSAVIFDKDGTLICFHSMWTPWISDLVKNINMELSMDLTSYIYSILGVCSKTHKAQPGLIAEGTKDQIKQALQKVIAAETGLSLDESMKVINKHYQNNASNSETLKEIHNIQQLFKIIHQHGIKIGICTSDNREGTLSSLASLNAQFFVDSICCGDDPNSKPKPDPFNSHILSKELSVPVNEMVMVGDTRTDMEFGKNSGMAGTIGVLSGVGDMDHLREGGAQEIIYSVQDILPHLISEAPINLTKYSNIITSKKWKLIIMDKEGTLTDVYSRYIKWANLLGERLQWATSEDIKLKFYDIVGIEKTQTFSKSSLLLESAVLNTKSVIRYLLILEGYNNKEADDILSKVWVETSIFGEDEIVDIKSSLLVLKSRGIKLALNSSDFKTSVTNFIKRNTIDDVFDMVLAAEDVSPHFKPLPNSILKICSDLNVSPKDTLVIADSQCDMLCAKLAKVGARIGVLSGIGRPQTLMGLCDVLLPNFNYLPTLLQHNGSESSDSSKIVTDGESHRKSDNVNKSICNGVQSFEKTIKRNYCTSKVKRQLTDYVVVGAGSAGCVIANRLTEDPDQRVHLLEAGPKDNTWTISMPAALMYNLCHDKYNWFYTTAPQRHMNNREMYWPRGRVLGGSSSLNAMAYVRGHALDYDNWEHQGAKGWNYQSCLAYFKKSQTHELGEDDYRGGSGPLHVSRGKTNNPLHDAWINAGVQAGYGFTDDMNGYRQEGFGMMDMTVHKGERWSSSRAYLRPIMKRSNLSISTNVLVTKILFEGKQAVGVEMLKDNELIQLMADKEVILCGGAINSPQLLMLSGIGDGDHLREHGIDVVEHVPGVGQNLQDHLEVYVQYRCLKPITLYIAQWKFPHHMIRIGLQWFLLRSGWGASSHLESGAFIRSESAVSHPDIQYHFLPSTVNDHGRQMGTCHAFQAHVGPMRSQSRGQLRLVSADPRQHLFIDPNYNAFERDFWEFRQCVKLTREIIAQSTFDEYRGEELFPGTSIHSDKDIDEFIKNRADSAYHPSCTCPMGDLNKSSGNYQPVLDAECRVAGVDRLRVVDASIMPAIVSGNLNGPTIMLAERAADIIRGREPLTTNPPAAVWEPTYKNRQRESDPNEK